MVASPRALGMLRPVYSAALHRAIVREVAKDLVRQPTDKIERFILSKAKA
jgi:protein required for attachment to host cells